MPPSSSKLILPAALAARIMEALATLLFLALRLLLVLPPPLRPPGVLVGVILRSPQ